MNETDNGEYEGGGLKLNFLNREKQIIRQERRAQTKSATQRNNDRSNTSNVKSNTKHIATCLVCLQGALALIIGCLGSKQLLGVDHFIVAHDWCAAIPFGNISIPKRTNIDTKRS